LAGFNVDVGDEAAGEVIMPGTIVVHRSVLIKLDGVVCLSFVSHDGVWIESLECLIGRLVLLPY
jgi:hypothetical protein